MLRVVRYLVILLLDVVLAIHNPRRIRFACTNEPTPRPATTRNCRVWSHRKRTLLLLLAAPDSQLESMLEDGNQKQLKQLGLNRIRDPYSIGTEKAQNILQVAENKGWLPKNADFEPGLGPYLEGGLKPAAIQRIRTSNSCGR